MAEIHTIQIDRFKRLRQSEDYVGYRKLGDVRELKGVVALCAADGITRDFKNGTPLRKDFWSLIKLVAGYYPNPSPARKAAEIICDTFLDTADKYIRFERKGADVNTIIECAEGGNNFLKYFNQWHFLKLDYLAKDLAGCVASMAFAYRKDGYLFVPYGFIADCGVFLFDENTKEITINEGPNSRGDINKDVMEIFGCDFDSKDGREIIRMAYRNNPQNQLSYGAFTGQKEAMDFFRTGTWKIKPRNPKVGVYTDGLENAVSEKDFYEAVMEGNEKKIEEICRDSVKTEGSLVLANKFLQKS